MGTRYKPGDLIQPNCTTRCVCQDGVFHCQPQTCITDGATCYAWGDPHYTTFDSRKFDFQGDCEYVLTQPCNSSEFSVLVSNSAHNSYVSCTESVRVVIPSKNLDILLERGGKGTVTINRKFQNNVGDEAILQTHEVTVLRTGGHPHVILTELGVKVSWDGLYRVEVTVSTSWRGRLCGLCGNYNDDPNDDFMTANNVLVSSPNTFAYSWVTHDMHGTCSGLSIPPLCPVDVLNEAQIKCAELSREYFITCNGLIDPTGYIESCVYDYCNCNESDREECYCESLAAYAGACTEHGVILQKWRSNYCCKCYTHT